MNKNKMMNAQTLRAKIDMTKEQRELQCDMERVDGLLYYWDYVDGIGLYCSAPGAKENKNARYLLLDVHNEDAQNHVLNRDSVYIVLVNRKTNGQLLSYLVDKYMGEYSKSAILLDDIELKYLSNFLKPLRNVLSIIKQENIINGHTYEQLKIEYCLGFDSNSIEHGEVHDAWVKEIALPPFKPNTMYANLELNKPYTVEQLGIR